MTRLTFAGALFPTAVALLPEFLVLQWNVPFYSGGPSLLIIVVVTMDFLAQVRAQLVSHQYGGMLSRSTLRGYGSVGTSR